MSVRYIPESLPPGLLEEILEREHRRIAQDLGNIRDVVLNLYSFAAYAGLAADTEVAISDIGLTWQTLPFTIEAVTPRLLTQSVANNSITFVVDGVYRLSVAGTFEHNEMNSGRQMYLRFYNLTDGVAVPGEWRLFTGRNMAGTPANWVFIAEIDEALKDKEFVIQVGGTTDSYSSVDWSGEWAVNGVGEWRDPLQ